MCGIAGYSVRSGLAASTGRWPPRRCSRRSPNGAPTPWATPIAPARALRDRRQAAHARLTAPRARRRCPDEANQLLVHVRDYTKGHPSIAANNHPVRHGPIVGIHNGIILNDDELLAPHSCARAEPRMTVDSEAIFAIAAHSRNDARALEHLRGAMATAWLDEREPDVVFVARGSGRPLWVGEGREGVFFASTRDRARGRRALLRTQAAQARGAGRARGSRSRTAGSAGVSASGPTSRITKITRSRRCAHRRSGSSA